MTGHRLERGHSWQTWIIRLVGSFVVGLSLAGGATAQTPPLVYGMGTGNPDESAPPAAGYAVPDFARNAVNLAFETHRSLWGAPTVDTYLHGRPVVFWRDNDKNEGAAAGNFRPVSHGPLCDTVGQTGWCQSDKNSIILNSGSVATPWLLPMLVSHEFMHQKEREWWTPEVYEKYAPHWIYEGIGNGWGFGIMESNSEYSRRAIARNLVGNEYKPFYAFLFGLRYYDLPLDVDSAATFYPRDHPDYPNTDGDWRTTVSAGPGRCMDYGLLPKDDCGETAAAIRNAYPHVQMAGYTTGSFFRYMLRGQAQGARAVTVMMKRPAPRTRTSRAWLQWMDQGIRVAPVHDDTGGVVNGPDGRPLPIWPGGVRQIYSRMIAELADMPQIEGLTRSGEMSRSRYDAKLWSHGCRPVDLTQKDSITETVVVAAIASRCFNMRAPGEANGQSWVIVTASSADRMACDDLGLATRGQVVREEMTVLRDDGCSTSWTIIHAPFGAGRRNNSDVDQHVIIVNAADKAVETVNRLIEVDFTYFQMSGTISGAAEPDEWSYVEPLDKPGIARVKWEKGVGTLSAAKRSRPAFEPIKGPLSRKSPLPERVRLRVRPKDPRILPSLDGVEYLAPMPSMAIRPANDDGSSCNPEDRAAFECGPMMGMAFATGERNRILRAAWQTAGSTRLRHVAHAGSTALEEDMYDLATADLAQSQADVSAIVTRMANGRPARGAGIELFLPPLEIGQTGTFPARVNVQWGDGSTGGGGVINSLGPLGPRTENGCNVGTPPSRATVTITANRPGFIMGAFSARLYQPNPSESDEDVCARPYVSVGQIQMSFTAPGQQPPLKADGGTSEISVANYERYFIEDMSTVFQSGGGLSADLIARHGFSAGGMGAGGATANSIPGGATSSAAQCPAPGDTDAYIAAQIARMRDAGLNDASVLDPYAQALRSLPREALESATCDWIEEGRP